MDDHGFDFDEETVRLMDAILINIADDEQVKEEFEKLGFLRKLKDTYEYGPGPFTQILNKVSKAEQDRLRNNVDIRRLIADMDQSLQIIQSMLPPEKQREFRHRRGEIDRRQYYAFKQDGIEGK